jgi:hypothetical protein
MSKRKGNKLGNIISSKKTSGKSDAWFFEEFLEEVEKPHPLEEVFNREDSGNSFVKTCDTGRVRKSSESKGVYMVFDSDTTADDIFETIQRHLKKKK